MPASIGLTARVRNILTSLGAPNPQGVGPVEVGPFAFGVTLPDNDSTLVDLTLAANIYAPGIRANLGGSANNPDCVVLVTGVLLELSPADLVDADLSGLLRNVVLKHTPQEGKARYIALGTATRTAAHAVAVSAVDADEATLTEVQRTSRHAMPLDLVDAPLVVDMSVDSLECGTFQAVNQAAAIASTLWLYGFAWSGSQGKPSVADCGKAGPQLQSATLQSVSLPVPRQQR